MPQLLFGGLLALILLGFYVWSVLDAITIAQCKTNCPELSQNMTFLLNSIGGLISAVVLGVLGATKPGQFPFPTLVEKTLTGWVQTLGKIMPSVFIFVWIICGVLTVIFGFILYENVPALSASAKVWLGSAIGAVYAYFGIQPDDGNG